MQFSPQLQPHHSQKRHFFTYSYIEQQKKVQINLADLLDPWHQAYTFDCLLILNYDLNIPLLRMLQKKCSQIILVDGGANRFYKTQLKNSKKVKCIIGDYDEIQEQVCKYYKDKSIKLQKDPDQDTTDFQKAIKYTQKQQLKHVVVLGVFGGRLDHTLNSMHITQKFLKQKQQNHIILIGMNSLMVYLHPHIKYTLKMDNVHLQKKGCGLITFNKVNMIQTDGFKWNMGVKYHFSSLEWGNFLSTSNQIQKSEISVLASDPVFYIGEVRSVKDW